MVLSEESLLVFTEGVGRPPALLAVWEPTFVVCEGCPRAWVAIWDPTLVACGGHPPAWSDLFGDLPSGLHLGV